jgi:VCBS repeat-containing protein
LNVIAPGVLANDSDIDNDPLLVSLTSGPAHAASFTLNSDGSFSYTPAANYFGPDSFTYQVSDGDAEPVQATVSITVNAVNDAPNGVDDAATVAKNSSANTITVLGNDTDVDNDALSISSITQGAHGSVSITNGGSNVSYTPNANYSGTDSFTYRASDGQLESGIATVSVTILTPTAAPVPVSGRVLTPNGKGLNNAIVTITGPTGTARTVKTDSLGYFRFASVEVGHTYIVSVAAKRYSFSPQVVTVLDEIRELIFVPL